jgi:CheY-like chemotaxis protein
VTHWRILVVDDVQEVAAGTAELLRTSSVSSADDMADVEFTTDFDEALSLLAERHYDLLVLDVRNEKAVEPFAEAASGDDATEADVGLSVYEDVRARRFVPIIFLTAVPGIVEHLARPPFVAVVSKQAEFDELRDRVRDVFDSALPTIHRALLEHVEQITREFMADFVEQHWADLAAPPRKGDLAHLLLRRLALSLADGGEALAGMLADEPGVELQPDVVHPMRFYVVPPVGSWTTGDILRGPEIAVESVGVEAAPQDTVVAAAVEAAPQDAAWYVMLTPACDLVPERVKAEFVVLARCVPLESTAELGDWRKSAEENDGNPSNATRGRLESLMRGGELNRQQDRAMFLPAAWSVPDLVVDLQRIVHVPHDRLGHYERVATLDSPYAQALIERLGRYLGRVGTPDLDVSIPLVRLAQN